MSPSLCRLWVAWEADELALGECVDEGQVFIHSTTTIEHLLWGRCWGHSRDQDDPVLGDPVLRFCILFPQV